MSDKRTTYFSAGRSANYQNIRSATVYKMSRTFVVGLPFPRPSLNTGSKTKKSKPKLSNTFVNMARKTLTLTTVCSNTRIRMNSDSCRSRRMANAALPVTIQNSMRRDQRHRTGRLQLCEVVRMARCHTHTHTYTHTQPHTCHFLCLHSNVPTWYTTFLVTSVVALLVRKYWQHL